MEDVGETSGTEAGVGAEAAVVEDGQLLSGVAVAAVGYAVLVLCVAEPNLDMAAVAERLQLRGAATAESELRPRPAGVRRANP